MAYIQAEKCLILNSKALYFSLESFHTSFIPILVPSGATNEPDVCFMWRSHIKTFDGRDIYFPGPCTYKLIHDCQDDLFSVHVFADPLCKDLKNCRRAVNLYLGGLDIKVSSFIATNLMVHYCN